MSAHACWLNVATERLGNNVAIFLDVLFNFLICFCEGDDGLFGAVPRSSLDDAEEHLRHMHEKSHDLVSILEDFLY